MKELEAIVTAAEQARASNQTAALATVVGIEGSAYRLPGARMLIVNGRWLAGSISGGCLEDDVVLRAQEAISRNEALVTTYDTTSDDDIVFGVGLGCKGVITILIEPIPKEVHEADFIAFAKSCLQTRATGIVATVIRVEGQVSAQPGSRMLLRDGSVVADWKDDDLTSKVTRESEALSAETSRLVNITLPAGSAQVFIERIAPPVPLVIFGAGHDAMPVVRLAKALGWHVTLIDHRPAYGNATRFPDADRIIVCQPPEVSRHVEFSHETLALVMTHNYLRDRDLLEILLPTAVRYIGLLGPRKRTDQLLADLQDKGLQPSADQLERLYAPVGLDIGSESPTEVALSILSEMQAVMTHHRGHHLRERKRPIHQAESIV
ncbi:MAG TPA: XdhC family protein [Burkholderiales bacterium]|nr:XdhC family protein [Burkholderiales bacterium]